MTLSLVNSSHAVGTNTTLSTTLSYSANDLVVLDAHYGGGNPLTASSAAFGALSLQNFFNNDPEFSARWYFVAPSSQTNDTLTITQGVSASLSIDAYNISGENTSTPWDAGGNQHPAGPDPANITTVNAITMALAYFKESSTANPTAGSGFTQISGADSVLVEYKLLSTAQTLSCTQTTGAGNAAHMMLDAVIDAVQTGPKTPSTLTLMGIG